MHPTFRLISYWKTLGHIEGCPRDWGNLPRPDNRLTVGIDAGFIHAREGDDRKAGWFEVIVGKSLQSNSPPKRIGYITTYDTKPKRRFHDMLQKQGLQLNQAITFLSDGGDNVRDLQLFLSPEAEHILDWFHITMRITVMKQMAKGLSSEIKANTDKKLSSIKWYLWHGNVFMALKTMENLLFNLEDENYSTGFAESTVNELVTRRMVKKQQMRWTKQGAHLLLQNRVKTLNNELRDHFCQWYPAMSKDAGNESELDKVA